jgi:uncharacterized protein (DUF433 family)
MEPNFNLPLDSKRPATSQTTPQYQFPLASCGLALTLTLIQPTLPSVSLHDRVSIQLERPTTRPVIEIRSAGLTDGHVKLEDKVEFRTDGEALIKGTGIEVHRIAALLSGGMSPNEILEDYPSLTLDQVSAAKAYAKAHPETAYSYPGKTVKRAFKGAGFEALDEVLGWG